MRTISISKLKEQLSAELKKVLNETKIDVLDYWHSVAQIIPADEVQTIFARESNSVYVYKKLEPLADADAIKDLEEERADRWYLSID